MNYGEVGNERGGDAELVRDDPGGRLADLAFDVAASLPLGFPKILI